MPRATKGSGEGRACHLPPREVERGGRVLQVDDKRMVEVGHEILLETDLTTPHRAECVSHQILLHDLHRIMLALFVTRSR